MNDFHGLPVCTLFNQFIELDCLATGGPRVVRLKYKGSDNLLAEVPQVSVPTPFGDYHYLGGHRLWHAPEAAPRSYIPDDAGLEAVQEIPSGLVLNGKVEPGTGIRKRIELWLDPDKPRVALVHTLINEGLWDVELSPWAITMFRLGGTAILPSRAGEGNADELLPDRHFSLWSYSHIGDPRLHLRDGFAAIRALPDSAPLKFGTFNSPGWIAYAVGNVLFRKSFTVRPGLRHPDYDCNAEIYCDDNFIELENLGPIQKISPGASVILNETWELYDSLDQGFVSPQMRELIESH